MCQGEINSTDPPFCSMTSCFTCNIDMDPDCVPTNTMDTSCTLDFTECNFSAPSVCDITMFYSNENVNISANGDTITLSGKCTSTSCGIIISIICSFNKFW